jgi:hypothetical protein
VVRSFLQSLRANVWFVLPLNRFLRNPFQFIIHCTISTLNSLNTLTASLNKPHKNSLSFFVYFPSVDKRSVAQEYSVYVYKMGPDLISKRHSFTLHSPPRPRPGVSAAVSFFCPVLLSLLCAESRMYKSTLIQGCVPDIRAEIYGGAVTFFSYWLVGEFTVI